MKQTVFVIATQELINENVTSYIVKILIDSLVSTFLQVIEILVNDLLVLLKCIPIVKSMWINCPMTLKSDAYDYEALLFISNLINDAS